MSFEVTIDDRGVTWAGYRNAVRRRFVRVGAYWIGPEAAGLLDAGNRLTAAVQSPREYDLVRGGPGEDARAKREGTQ
jgi:hypothetical protein